MRNLFSNDVLLPFIFLYLLNSPRISMGIENAYLKVPTYQELMGRSLITIIHGIREVLGSGDELSINQIAKRVNARWSTTAGALEHMKELGLVEERRGTQLGPSTRLFRQR